MLTIPLAALRWAASKVGAWLGSGSHLKWVAGAMTALLLAFLIIQLHAARSERDDAKDALEAARGEIALLDQARAADAEALASNAGAKTAIAKKASVSRERIEAALSANPDWASEPVPAGVIDSLR